MPEEINRVLTDHMSTLLFCPTDAAIENLAKEGITAGVHRVGDVMYDALLHNLALARKRSSILQSLGLQKGNYALATVHRAANTDNPSNLSSILTALGSLSMQVIFPVHPRTRKTIGQAGLTAPVNVKMIEPLGTFDFSMLEENADFILTDSGGIQKEAYVLGVRCITMREETEWVETVEAGWNKVVGADEGAIREAFEHWRPAGERPALYGDGDAAGEIYEILSKALESTG
jgi:UDP-N-acetylglucosamine 2-epimerase